MTATFACPRCGMASAHPTDIAEGYCGACHDWTADGHDWTSASRPGLLLNVRRTRTPSLDLSPIVDDE